MWWWRFNNKEENEPLQEDLIVYEKFMEYRRDRQRMDRDKAEQKERRKQQGGKGSGNSRITYEIPDPK